MHSRHPLEGHDEGRITRRTVLTEEATEGTVGEDVDAGVASRVEVVRTFLALQSQFRHGRPTPLPILKKMPPTTLPSRRRALLRQGTIHTIPIPPTRRYLSCHLPRPLYFQAFRRLRQ